MPRYGMVFELNKCTGCSACMIACKNRNGTPPGDFRCSVKVEESGTYPNVKVVNKPLLCMHCGDAPCVKVCPTGATFKREDGIVYVEKDRCMGCKYCMLACPYEARHEIKITPYEPEFGFTELEEQQYAKHTQGVVDKCNFCADWLEQGLQPACVGVCMYDARHFGDLDDPNSEVSKLLTKRHTFQLLPELGTNPSVYYVV